MSHRLLTLALACCAGGAILFSQAPVPPQGGPPAAPAEGAPGQGRGVVDPPGADFVKRAPVVRQTPEAQLGTFALPPGFKLEPVLADPLIEDPVGVTFDGNGR